MSVFLKHRITCIVTLLATAAGCSSPSSHHDETSPPLMTRQNETVTIPAGSPLRAGLVFDTAQMAVRSNVVLATATVESDPAHTVPILPPLAGRIVAVHVRLGDAVRQGQPLVTLDSPDFTSAQADFDRARSAFRQATNNLGRERQLWQYDAAARRDVEQAETDYAQADGDLRRAAAHLTLLGIDTSAALAQATLVIRSPIAGRVTDLSVGVGEFHNDPTVPVMTIADLTTVYLTANVPEKDVHAIQVGERAAAVLSAYPDDTVRGVVSMVGATVDTATRMTKARVQLANPDDRFKPGMYGMIAFAAPPHPTVIVPTTSLLQIGDSSYVFLETKPWTLQRQSVVVGAVDSGHAVVRAGLSAGQRIVASQVVLFQ